MKQRRLSSRLPHPEIERAHVRRAWLSYCEASTAGTEVLL